MKRLLFIIKGTSFKNKPCLFWFPVDKVCQRLVEGLWFSVGTTISSTNKIGRRNISGILLKVALTP
jgi:hypothetical protein